MYKSAHRFMLRAPGTRFWTEYAPTYQLKAVDSEEVLISALADTLTARSSRPTIRELSDYEVAGLAMICATKSLLGGLADRLAADLDQRLEREGEQISFSDNERRFWESVLEAAAKLWRRR
jgi:hypothetical protein